MKRMFSLFVMMIAVLASSCATSLTSPESTGPKKTVIERISKSRNYGTTFRIVSTHGTVIVADPYTMPKGTLADIVTCTHGHFDHWDTAFVNSVAANTNVKISYASPGTFTWKDVTVTGVAASHDSAAVDPESPSDVITIFEVDGLRIAHMGDLGQESLSAEQLQAIGKIDIAFMQLVNSYSGMSLENGKGFQLIAQFNPQVVIVTHTSAEATAKLGEIYGKLETVQDSWSVRPEDLSGGTKKVIDLK